MVVVRAALRFRWLAVPFLALFLMQVLIRGCSFLFFPDLLLMTKKLIAASTTTMSNMIYN